MSLDVSKDGLNSLIQKFLVELKNIENRKSSKMEFVYSNALKSLKNYDSKIMCVKDCQKIKYFGQKICNILQNKLDDYCKNNIVLNFPINVTSTNNSTEILEDNVSQNIMENNIQTNEVVKKKKSNRQYIPKFKSSGFAIMIALYKLEKDEKQFSVSKIDLINAAEKYLNDYSDNELKGSMLNTWAAIKTLIKKELIFVERSRCNYYSLTEIGRELSAKMYLAMCAKNGDQNECEKSSNLNSEKDLEEDDNRNIFMAGTFKIILLIDSREHYSGISSDQKKTKILSDLQNMGINCQIRTLSVGDFAWIVKPLATNMKKELILDFLIERKKLDDLISSMHDQRWGEQKYRLKRCGLRNITYLIEGMSACKNDNAIYKSVIQALSNAQIIDGFNMKFTNDFNETLTYLAVLTKYLEKYYSNRNLYTCSKQDKLENKFDLNESYLITYGEFCNQSMKISNFTAKEMFVRNLLRFNGITLEKCKAITDIYETLPTLLRAYNECQTDKTKKKLLSTITYGTNNSKSIGNLLSDKIYTYYTTI